MFHTAKPLCLSHRTPAASDEADILGLMIDEYEKKYYQIEAPDPIEAIKIRMQEMHLKQVDLIDLIGGKNRVSEVLNRKRNVINIDR